MIKSKISILIVASALLASCATPLTPAQIAEKSIEDEKKLKIHTSHLIKYCAAISSAKAYMDKNNEDTKYFRNNPECIYYAENGNVKDYKIPPTPGGLFGLPENLVKERNLFAALGAKIPENVIKMGKTAEELYRKVYIHGLSDSSMHYVSKTKEFKSFVNSYNNL